MLDSDGSLSTADQVIPRKCDRCTWAKMQILARNVAWERSKGKLHRRNAKLRGPGIKRSLPCRTD
jgi:hypothetical protein